MVVTFYESSDLLAAVAAHGIGTTDTRVDEPLDPQTWSELVALVRSQRLEPQLATIVAAGAWPVTDDQAEQAEAIHAAAMATTLLLDRQLLDVAREFDARELRVAVLKGSAMAHLDYPNPSLRAYGDIDLLVAPEDIETAEQVLIENGGRRAFTEPRPGFDRRFGKGSSYRMPSGLEIDLHRTLALGPFGLAVDPVELAAGHEDFVVGGCSLRALDGHRRFLHACYHAVLGRSEPRLVPLIDVVMSAPRTEHDMRAVVELAHRWQADVVVDAAVAAAIGRLCWRVPAHIAAGFEEFGFSTRQRRWLRSYRDERRSSALLTIAAVEAIPRWDDRVDYVRAALWPAGKTPKQAVQRLGRGGAAIVRGR